MYRGKFSNISFHVSLILILLPTICSASPMISKAYIENRSIFISGSGFGQKNPASPILWENFEDGVLGENLSTTGKWIGGAGGGGKFSNERAYSGSLAAYNQVAGPNAVGPNLGSFNTSQFFFSGVDELFYSYRWYGQNNAPDVELPLRLIIKNGRIGSDRDAYRGPGSMYYSDGAVAYDAGSGYSSTGYIGYVKLGVWERHDLYKKLSTPGGSDGALRVEVNYGERLRDLKSIITRNAGETFQHDSVLLGMEESRCSGISNCDYSFFVDDVYIDKTVARVEIGNSPDFSSTSNREIQIPTDWNNNHIVVNLNKGSFSEGDAIYVFVVDPNGTPSTGFGPITIGSPKSPENLTLIREMY